MSKSLVARQLADILEGNPAPRPPHIQKIVDELQAAVNANPEGSGDATTELRTQLAQANDRLTEQENRHKSEIAALSASVNGKLEELAKRLPPPPEV